MRAFCREHFPADLARKADAYVHFSKADRVRWQRLLDERGWFIGHWPVELGGQGWGPLQRFIFIEELEYAGTPWLTHFGVSFAGPLLCAFGSQMQQRRYLPAIRNSTAWWCQGFSEPGAGSDLASVRTRARRAEGDDYIVSGQKTWITMAHWADMMFALVRTERGGPAPAGPVVAADRHARHRASVCGRSATIDGASTSTTCSSTTCACRQRIWSAAEGQGWACAKFIVEQRARAGHRAWQGAPLPRSAVRAVCDRRCRRPALASECGVASAHRAARTRGGVSALRLRTRRWRPRRPAVRPASMRAC